MRTTIKNRMTYANVASTAALFIAIAGGGVAAASMVPRNSVGSAQLINNTVKSIDIRDRTIKASDITGRPIGVVRGYAWMNNPGGSGTLTNGYIYNEGGGPVSSTRTGTGTYAVEFDGLNIGSGHVQVSAYGANAVMCKVDSWGSSSAFVRCFDAAGSPADSEFTVAMVE